MSRQPNDNPTQILNQVCCRAGLQLVDGGGRVWGLIQGASYFTGIPTAAGGGGVAVSYAGKLKQIDVTQIPTLNPAFAIIEVQ